MFLILLHAINRKCFEYLYKQISEVSLVIFSLQMPARTILNVTMSPHTNVKDSILQNGSKNIWVPLYHPIMLKEVFPPRKILTEHYPI